MKESTGASKRGPLRVHRGKWGCAGEGEQGLSLQAAANWASGGLAGVEQGTCVQDASLKLSADS